MAIFTILAILIILSDSLNSSDKKARKAVQFSPAVNFWRSRRDSNPRYPFRYTGFQDQGHQPLGHDSRTTLVGGGSEIRTHGTFRFTVVPGLPHKPLAHPTVLLNFGGRGESLTPKCLSTLPETGGLDTCANTSVFTSLPYSLYYTNITNSRS